MKIEKMDLLVAVYIFCICASELMGAKTFPLFSLFGLNLSASVAIFTFPLIYSINDIITEIHGVERTRSVVRTGLLVVGLIFIFSLLATSLPPSTRFEKTEAAYDTIFGLTMRISLASLTAFAIAEFTDVFIFQKIRQKLGKKALWLRNNVSNFISQFFDTAIFMTLAFYALDKSFANNAIFLIGLILPYWLIKCVASVLETPLVYWGVKFFKK